jgi:hypothetical protein
MNQNLSSVRRVSLAREFRFNERDQMRVLRSDFPLSSADPLQFPRRAPAPLYRRTRRVASAVSYI